MASIHMTRPTSPYASSSSDTDSIIASNNVTSPSGTALRRLYFRAAKTGRTISTATKTSSTANVPKVIVMNSSCNSTINTSTESASTHLTNITTTTDTETCDSLDLGKWKQLQYYVLSWFSFYDLIYSWWRYNWTTRAIIKWEPRWVFNTSRHNRWRRKSKYWWRLRIY